MSQNKKRKVKKENISLQDLESFVHWFGGETISDIEEEEDRKAKNKKGKSQ